MEGIELGAGLGTVLTCLNRADRRRKKCQGLLSAKGVDKEEMQRELTNEEKPHGPIPHPSPQPQKRQGQGIIHIKDRAMQNPDWSWHL